MAWDHVCTRRKGLGERSRMFGRQILTPPLRDGRDIRRPDNDPLEVEIEEAFPRDKMTKNWWLRLQGVDMGYWPKELFPFLLEGADIVAVGGEILYQGGGAHTSTQMGSGHFAEEGFKKSSFIKNIQVLDSSYVYKNPRTIAPVVDAERCYDLQI
ncbi:hypothetical protein Taro_055300, partial [Colocasia esculenta]|nr:hypothetical protein [Colocasia esculenta]